MDERWPSLVVSGAERLMGHSSRGGMEVVGSELGVGRSGPGWELDEMRKQVPRLLR